MQKFVNILFFLLLGTPVAGQPPVTEIPTAAVEGSPWVVWLEKKKQTSCAVLRLSPKKIETSGIGLYRGRKKETLSFVYAKNLFQPSNVSDGGLLFKYEIYSHQQANSGAPVDILDMPTHVYRFTVDGSTLIYETKTKPSKRKYKIQKDMKVSNEASEKARCANFLYSRAEFFWKSGQIDFPSNFNARESLETIFELDPKNKKSKKLLGLIANKTQLSAAISPHAYRAYQQFGGQTWASEIAKNEADSHAQNLATANDEYLPIVKVQPQYPRRAIMRGMVGWATVEFTVTEQGKVLNPVVVENCAYVAYKVIGVCKESPNTVFDQAALKAVSKFLYRPKVVNGEAVSVQGVQNRIGFSLGGTPQTGQIASIADQQAGKPGYPNSTSTKPRQKVASATPQRKKKKASGLGFGSFLKDLGSYVNVAGGTSSIREAGAAMHAVGIVTEKSAEGGEGASFEELLNATMVVGKLAQGKEVPKVFGIHDSPSLDELKWGKAQGRKSATGVLGIFSAITKPLGSAENSVDQIAQIIRATGSVATASEAGQSATFLAELNSALNQVNSVNRINLNAGQLIQVAGNHQLSEEQLMAEMMSMLAQMGTADEQQQEALLRKFLANLNASIETLDPRSRLMFQTTLGPFLDELGMSLGSGSQDGCGFNTGTGNWSYDCIQDKAARDRQINADRTDHSESVGNAAGAGQPLPPDALALVRGSPWYIPGDPRNVAMKFYSNGSFKYAQGVTNNFDWNASVDLYYKFILYPATKTFIYQQTGAEVKGRTYGMKPLPIDGKVYRATYQINGNTFIYKCTIAGCGQNRTSVFKSR